MELILWRHADAEPHGLQADKDRPLTSLGQKQAKKMASFLKTRLPKDVILYSSPATRCQETISALKLPYETSKLLSTDASVSDLLELVEWHSESITKQTILVCGHQPTLGQVISKILTGHCQYWAVKKGAIWWLSSRTRRQDEQAWVKAVLTYDVLNSKT